MVVKSDGLLDALKLEPLINVELIESVCDLFGVRRAWVEGEAGRIYDPLCLYKDLPAFAKFVQELKERNPDDICSLKVLKPSASSDDLYADHPDIGLYFSEPIADLGDKIIYRFYPIHGPLPWDHSPALFHLCAFFNVVYETSLFPVKGYSVPSKHVAKVSSGEAIPRHNVKVTSIWHPEDYSYPLGQHNGRVKHDDWRGLMDYFGKGDEDLLLKGFSKE